MDEELATAKLNAKLAAEAVTAADTKYNNAVASQNMADHKLKGAKDELLKAKQERSHLAVTEANQAQAEADQAAQTAENYQQQMSGGAPALEEVVELSDV
jgi:hypothetical protein